MDEGGEDSIVASAEHPLSHQSKSFAFQSDEDTNVKQLHNTIK